MHVEERWGESVIKQLSEDLEQYPIDEVLLNQVDTIEPNYDRISAIANEWIFIEH